MPSVTAGDIQRKNFFFGLLLVFAKGKVTSAMAGFLLGLRPGVAVLAVVE